MMGYRVNANELVETLHAWDEVIPGRGKIRLIACGGTALTLLGYKESTKDIDFLVPRQKEYQRLVKFLKQAGYKEMTTYGWKRTGESILFDLYPGKRIYSTELLSSPLKQGGNRKIREWKTIYLGILNSIDLIISKMFRGTEVDIEDSLALLKNEKVDFSELENRYAETARYDVSEKRVMRNFSLLRARLGRAKP